MLIFLILVAIKTSIDSSDIKVLAANKISPVSVSTISEEITFPIRYSSGALIESTFAVCSILTCLAVILRPCSTTTSLPILISNSAIIPLKSSGLITKSHDLDYIFTVI